MINSLTAPVGGLGSPALNQAADTYFSMSEPEKIASAARFDAQYGGRQQSVGLWGEISQTASWAVGSALVGQSLSQEQAAGVSNSAGQIWAGVASEFTAQADVKVNYATWGLSDRIGMTDSRYYQSQIHPATGLMGVAENIAINTSKAATGAIAISGGVKIASGAARVAAPAVIKMLNNASKTLPEAANRARKLQPRDPATQRWMTYTSQTAAKNIAPRLPGAIGRGYVGGITNTDLPQGASTLEKIGYMAGQVMSFFD